MPISRLLLPLTWLADCQLSVLNQIHILWILLMSHKPLAYSLSLFSTSYELQASYLLFLVCPVALSILQYQIWSTDNTWQLPATKSTSQFLSSPAFQWKNWAKQAKNILCVLQHLRNEDSSSCCCLAFLSVHLSQLNVYIHPHIQSHSEPTN